MSEKINHRESNIELCRIVAMSLIVLNHLTSLGQTVDGVSFSSNTILSLFFLLGGKMGTNVFVILGLYFLVDRGTYINFKAIARIWLQTIFYSILLNIVDIYIWGIKISKVTWARSFFPILGRSYWFASAYIVLLLMIPFIRMIWDRVNKKKEILIFLGIILSLIPTLSLNGRIFGSSLIIIWVFKVLRYELVWFPFLYILTDYMKKNGVIKKQSSVYWLACFCLIYLVMWVIEIIMYKAGIDGNDVLLYNYSSVRDMTSVLCLLSSFCFFMYFKEMKKGYSKIINTLGGMTFGIYLLHNHEASIPVIYEKIFNFQEIATSTAFFHYCVVSIAFLVIVFVVAIIIEFFRKKIEYVIFSNSVVNRIINSIQSKIDYLNRKIIKKGLYD